MKKRILLFTSVVAFGFVILTSSSHGGSYTYGVDGTGASGSPSGTCAQGGCHGSGTTTTVALELDSASIPVTHYIAGHSYTIKITGTNTSSSLTLPGFGFQIAAVKATGAGTTSAQNAGTFSTSLPASTRLTTAAQSITLPIDVIEQSLAQRGITATTGSGGSGTTYVESIGWTAPATAGTGSVKIYGCINAVNNNNSSNGDVFNAATPITITELIPSAVTSFVADANIKVYPNPCGNQFHLQMNNADAGTYTVKAYDMSGRCLMNENIEINSNSYETSINTADWAPGFYGVQIIKDGAQRIVPLIKQ